MPNSCQPDPAAMEGRPGLLKSSPRAHRSILTGPGRNRPHDEAAGRRSSLKRAKESAALGFESHSGWAALVAVGGSRREPAVLLRERVTLVAAEPGAGEAKQPFHAAEAMPFPRARAFIEAAAAKVSRRARAEMERVLAALTARGFEPASCAVLAASNRELPNLEAILASHALIHAAEGDFFRDAIAEAAKASGLEVTRIRRKDLSDHASTALGLPAPELERRVAHFRKSVGAPWGSDQKLAALAAWSVLGTSVQARDRRAPGSRIRT